MSLLKSVMLLSVCVGASGETGLLLTIYQHMMKFVAKTGFLSCSHGFKPRRAANPPRLSYGCKSQFYTPVPKYYLIIMFVCRQQSSPELSILPNVLRLKYRIIKNCRVSPTEHTETNKSSVWKYSKNELNMLVTRTLKCSKHPRLHWKGYDDSMMLVLLF